MNPPRLPLVGILPDVSANKLGIALSLKGKKVGNCIRQKPVVAIQKHGVGCNGLGQPGITSHRNTGIDRLVNNLQAGITGDIFVQNHAGIIRGGIINCQNLNVAVRLIKNAV